MSDKNQLLLAIITTGIAIIFGLGGWVNMSIGEVRQDIRELRLKVDRNTEAIARLEGVLIGDQAAVPAATVPPDSAPAQTALN